VGRFKFKQKKAFKSFPPLYYQALTGKIHVWRIWTEENRIFTEYGEVGGKQQRSRKVAEGVNIGKVNMRSPNEQAQATAQSMWKNRVERRYALSPKAAKEPLVLPMLAHKIEGRKFDFPVFVQPKLNGVRALARWNGNVVELVSRNGKLYRIPHISAELKQGFLPHGPAMVDGELYCHGERLQTIVSWVKRLQENTNKITYHVYDMPVDESGDVLIESQRQWNLSVLFAKRPRLKGKHFLRRVPLHTADSMKSVLALEREFVRDGYEGAIVRVKKASYLFGRRSSGLLKVKSFEDAEFKVVGVADGEGKMEGCAIFICKTKQGKEFNAVMACSMAERKRQYIHRKKYLGAKLTVKFFGWTKDKKPFHPVGVAFRDRRDLP